METKKIDFIIKHFGCYTLIGGENVLTSLATMSFVPVNDFWNVFTGDEYKYFQISKTESGKELVLIIDDVLRKQLEREIIKIG